MALGVAQMDATHLAFVEQIEALQAANDAMFAAGFFRLLEHTRQHFEEEARLMRKHRFAAIGEHESEHLRVLGELAHFSRGIKLGRLTAARVYVRALPDWFANHLRTMDAALAARIKAGESV